MARKTKADIRAHAARLVELYNATLRIEDTAAVRKGRKQHLDTGLEPTDGWWVDCQIFVPADLDDTE